MNYVEEVTKYLTERGVAVWTEPPQDVDVHMFDVVSCPIPFEPNEAEALNAVAECVFKFHQEIAKRAPEAVVFLGPGPEIHPQGVRQVAVQAGFLAWTAGADHYFVVGPEGGDIERRPRKPVEA